MEQHLKQNDDKSKLVFINKNNTVRTTSLKVAEAFRKRHGHVMRDIENLIARGVPNFGHTLYTHPQNGQTYKMYEMDRDGYSLLAMGFTGNKALRFKIRFIEAFNAMEAELLKQRQPKQSQMSQMEILAETTKHLVNHEKKLNQVETAITENKTAVEEIQHKIDTNGCEPGFIPRKEAHSLCGRTLSYDMFKEIIREYQHPSSRYIYHSPHDGKGIGVSVEEKGLAELMLGFTEQCTRVTDYFFEHPDFGDRKFRVFEDVV